VTYKLQSIRYLPPSVLAAIVIACISAWAKISQFYGSCNDSILTTMMALPNFIISKSFALLLMFHIVVSSNIGWIRLKGQKRKRK
jgi:hypothetical protein